MRPFSDVDLHGFVDNQVNPERRALIAAYLDATPSDAARIQGWRRQNEAIRSLFASTASEPVPLWLTIGQVAAGRGRSGPTAGHTADGRPLRPVPSRRTVPTRRSPNLVLKAVLLAVVAFAAGVGTPTLLPQWSETINRWLPVTPHAEQIRRVAARTLEAHRTFGLDPDQPAEVVDQPSGRLATWFRHRLELPVRVPDLSHLGWRLRGGRVVPGDLGPAALMVYDNAAGERLSLTATPVRNPSPSDTSYTLSGPVLAWLDGPVGFGVTTSLDDDWLSSNAHALYRGIYASAED